MPDVQEEEAGTSEEVQAFRIGWRQEEKGKWRKFCCVPGLYILFLLQGQMIMF